MRKNLNRRAKFLNLEWPIWKFSFECDTTVIQHTLSKSSVHFYRQVTNLVFNGYLLMAFSAHDLSDEHFHILQKKAVEAKDAAYCM